MRVIIPTAITPDMVVSSTVTEPSGNEEAWTASDVYARGDQAFVDHVIYESLRGEKHTALLPVASPGKVSLPGYFDEDGAPKVPANGEQIAFRTTGTLPTGITSDTVYFVVSSDDATKTFSVAATAGGTPINFTGSPSGTHTAVLTPNKNQPVGELTEWWFKVGPTNKYALLDDDVDTATTAAVDITYVLDPGLVTGWAMFGLIGNELDVEAKVGSETVYGPYTYSLDGSVVIDDWTYMFAPFLQRTSVIDAEVPPFDARWTFTVKGASTRQVSSLKMGESVYVGSVEDGSASSSSISYTGVSETPQGKVKIIKRRKVPEVSTSNFVELQEVNAVAAAMDRLDGEVFVVVGDETDEGLRSPLNFLGFLTEEGLTHHVTHSILKFTARGI